uniref:Uncharacterized protein LOC103319823 isoform X2 n=1 Tax=Rhizophora mucronata TaxID=61149 RepID=A0A2P2LT18_RHIMU
MNKCDERVNNVENWSTVGKKIKILEDCPRKPAGQQAFERFPQNIPEVKNLRHVESMVRLARSDHSLLPLTSLLRAAPSLYEFKMKFPVAKASSNGMKVIKEEQPLQCLKTVEILGFVGGAADTELVLYLLENAVELEKLIIDTCEPCFMGTSLESEHRGCDKCEAARQRAAELVARVPPGAELVVL